MKFKIDASKSMREKTIEKNNSGMRKVLGGKPSPGQSLCTVRNCLHVFTMHAKPFQVLLRQSLRFPPMIRIFTAN
jgi:hypothetical protein